MKHTTTSRQKKLPDKPQGTFRARLLNYFTSDEKSSSTALTCALVFSYLQIVFGNIHLVFYYIQNDHTRLSDVTHLISDFFAFDDLFHYGHDDGILLLVCCCILLYFVLFITGLVFTFFQASKSQQPKTLLTRITSFLIQTHALVLFMPISNFANRLQVETMDNHLTRIYFELGKGGILSISIVVYVINALLAIVPYIWLYHILPSANPLSSKNFYVDQSTLYQKLLVPLVARLLYGTVVSPWIIMPGNILISLIRQFWCLYSMPRYHLTTFMLDMYGVSFNTILPILVFIIFIINKLVDVPMTSQTIIIILLASFPPVILFIRNRLWQHLTRILYSTTKVLGPYKSIYKLQVLKYYENHLNRINKKSDEVDENYFFFSVVNKFPDKIFGPSTAPKNPIDLETKQGKYEIKRNYLEYLTTQYNRHDEFKLMLAKFYSKSLMMYTLAIKLIMKVKSESGSFYARASAEALHLQVQEQILTKEQTKNGKLNFVAYTNELSEQEKLKEEIKKQLGYHIAFWQEYSENKSNAYKLQNLAQLIQNQRMKIEKIWTHLENKPDKKYYHLCLLYSRYQLLLNNSTEKASKYLQKHTLFNKQYDIKVKLDVATLFDVNNFSVTITTHQENVGLIKHSSHNIQKALGYQQDVLIGTNVGVLMSPYVAERHNSFLNHYLKTGKAVFIGSIRSVFLRNSSGLLVKSSIFTNIHPFVDEDVYLTALFRLDKEDTLEYIFVTPEGEIDSCTAGIAAKLGIHKKNAHIENICSDPELIIGPVSLSKIDKAEERASYRGIETHHGHDNIYLTSKEDLLPSPTGKYQQLLSARLNSPTVLLSDRSRILSTENEKEEEPKEKVYPKDILDKQRINFNFYSLFPNRMTQTFSYECTVTTLPVKKDYLRVIAIEMIDPKKRAKKQSIDNEMVIGEELDSPKELIKNLEVNPGSMANINKSSSSPEKGMQTQEQSKTPQPIQTLQKKKINGPLSTGSTTSGGHNTSTYIEEALRARYYPRRYYIFMVTMAVTALAILVLVVQLKISNGQATEKVKGLTTIMDLANLRADAFTSIARTTRGTYIVRENLLVPGSNTSIGNINYINNNFPTQIAALKEYNAELQFAIQDVDDSFKKSFTVADVRIYDFNEDLEIESYRTFNTFMAINLLIEKLLNLAKNYATIFPMHEIHALFQNLLNDLLVSTIRAVDIISEEIQSSVQSSVSMVHTFQIICMVLAGLRFTLALIHYYSLYNAELVLLQKFFTIVPRNVQILRQKLVAFSQFLDEENLGNLGKLDTLEVDDAYYIERGANSSNKHKTSRLDKNLKKTNLQKQYWKRVILYFILMTIQVVQLNMMFIRINNQVRDIGRKINSLSKTESIQYELATLSFTLSQVLSNDNVTTIRNLSPEVELGADLDKLSTYTNVLMTAFTERDGTVDPIVNPFFFGDVCQLASSNVKSSCITIAKGSKTLGLFALLSRHHQIITNLYSNFTSSNKTFLELQGLVLGSFTTVIPSFTLIKDLLSQMVTQIRNNIIMLYEDFYHEVEIHIALNIISVLLFMFLTNRFVYRYISNYFNRFKRMLEIVPFDVLLSNPTLKGILIISSKGKLNRIKNEI